MKCRVLAKIAEFDSVEDALKFIRDIEGTEGRTPKRGDFKIKIDNEEEI